MQINSRQIMKFIKEAEFEELVANPASFVESFSDIEEFKNWAMEGTILDIKELTRVLEAHQLYEHCQVLKDILDELQS